MKRIGPKMAAAVEKLTEVIGTATITDKRRKRLLVAIVAGASDDVLALIRDASRTSTSDTIVLPAHRYEGLSRGRGWARNGRGDNVTWGDRCDGGYRVWPGRWSIGASVGFSRRDSVEWTVKNITVGDKIWTVAS